MQALRQTMVKARISDIINGKFVRKEGFEPSYVLTGLGQRISRTKIIGTIVDKFMSEDGNYSSVTVDDDTSLIRVKAFREDVNIFGNLELGDMVVVIGKAREYADENYIIPEIVKKLADPNHESLHRLEVIKQLIKQKKIAETIDKEKDNFANIEELRDYIIKKYKVDSQTAEAILETMSEKETEKKDYKPLVLETIERMNEGEGVEIIKLMQESKLPENIFEEVMNELLTKGICYEPIPGVVKKA